MVTVECARCAVSFEARSPRAKWCSDACRKAAQRAAVKDSTAAPAPDARETTPVDDGLVGQVRRDLEAADRLGTFYGQLAVKLAARLSNPDEAGISALSKELRVVMEAALAGAPTPDGSVEPVVPDEDDEVKRARENRERKAREAAAR